MNEIISCLENNNPHVKFPRAANSIAFITDVLYDSTKLRRIFKSGQLDWEKVPLSLEFISNYADDGSGFDSNLWKYLSWRYQLPTFIFEKYWKHLDWMGVSWTQIIPNEIEAKFRKKLNSRALEMRELKPLLRFTDDDSVPITIYYNV